MILELKRLLIHLWLLGPWHGLRVLWQWGWNRPIITFRLRGVPVTLHCRRAVTDLHVLRQIFWRHELAVPLPYPPATILDGGAHIGLAAVDFRRRYPQARLLCVEPDRDNAAVLRRNCAALGNATVVDGAVWYEDGPLAIVNPDATSWEFRVGRPAAPSTAPVPGYTIGTLLDDAGWERVDLVKLDIEGAEKHVFSAGVGDWIDRVGYLLIELHDRYEPGCLDAVRRAADAHGWTLTEQPGSEYVLLAPPPPPAGRSTSRRS